MGNENENPAPRRRCGASKVVRLGKANAPEINSSRSDFQRIGASHRNGSASIHASAGSKIVRFGRAFRPRLAVGHRQCSSTGDWAFTLHHLDEKGRYFVGEFDDVEVAFHVARAFRNQGVRVVSVDRVRP